MSHKFCNVLGEDMKKVENIILCVLCIVFVILFILFKGVSFIGYRPYIVTSGSMIPKYPVNSIVYTNTKVEFDELKVGDDITFELQEGTLATHRIDSIDYSSKEVRTYGINNKDSQGHYLLDGKITTSKDIVGRVDFSISYLGTLYEFCGTTHGKIIIIGGVGVLFIIFRLLEKLETYWEENKNGKEKK